MDIARGCPCRPDQPRGAAPLGKKTGF